MFTARKQIRADLHIFLTIVSTLTIIGALFIYSSSSIYALEKFGSSHYYVKKQLVGLLLGIIALIGARIVPLAAIQKLSPLFFFSTLGLTAMTLLPSFGTHIHGSSRWLRLFGLTFQPSELLKVAFILYIAHFLEKKEYKKNSFFHAYIPFLLILGVVCGVLLKQPDFGLTVTLFTTAFTLLFIAQFQTRHLAWTFAAMIPAVVALILYKPYRLKRVLTFLNPWDDPQGSGFQIIQSLIAIGSGNVWGTGISHSKQKFFYLPMQHTDFIFSIIAEETGFVGSFFLIFLFVLFLYFGIKMAWQMKNTFSSFATLGFVVLISLQAVINLSVATGLVPTKGMGLPFISYGNTSLVCTLAMIGIIINFVHNDYA